MSFLDCLKARLTDDPDAAPAAAVDDLFGSVTDPFEGFEGASDRRVCQPEKTETPPNVFGRASLELLQSRSETQVHARSRAQTPLPQAPSKPPKGMDPLLGGRITLDHIRAAVERERNALAIRGQFGPAAEARAVAITRAKLGNAPDLAERQAHDGRCHACGQPLDDSRPVVAITTGRPRAALWLHAGTCHDTHSRRHAERMDAFMAAAGFPTPAGAPAPAQ